MTTVGGLTHWWRELKRLRATNNKGPYGPFAFLYHSCHLSSAARSDRHWAAFHSIASPSTTRSLPGSSSGALGTNRSAATDGKPIGGAV